MTTLFEEYFRQRSDLVEADKKPIGVVFSHAGWSKALKEEADAGRNMVTQGPSATYGGLHRWIDPELTAELVVTDKTQVQWFEDRRLSRAAHAGMGYSRQNAITVKIDGIMSGAPVVEIIAANLKAAQLCDIIRAWLDSDDATHWGDFEKALDKVVTEHGTFE